MNAMPRTQITVPRTLFNCVSISIRYNEWKCEVVGPAEMNQFCGFNDVAPRTTCFTPIGFIEAIQTNPVLVEG